MSTFLDQMTQSVEYQVARRMGVARASAQRSLRAAAPVGKARPFSTEVPGTLRDSIAVNVRYARPVFTLTCVAAAPHASYTNDGTSAFAYLVQRPPSPSGHPGAVRFFWDRSGGIEFRPTGWLIQNPGIQARHWWTQAMQSLSDVVANAA